MDAPEQVTKQQTGYDNEEQADPKKGLRDKVNLVLPDGLMIVLALIMVPLVVVPLLIDLPESVAEALTFADYTILGIFVSEYLLKTALAKDIRRRVLNPWHLLDLLVIVLPLFDFLQVFVGGIGRSSPMLRLLRVARVVAVSGRVVDRTKRRSPIVMEAPSKSGMEIRVVESDLENIHKDVSLGKVGEYLSSSSHTWIDFSSVSESNFDELSTTLGVPRLVLESELIEESYPRVDYFEHYSMIFARVADIRKLGKGARRLFVNRSGLLVMCCGQNIITVSKRETNSFSQIMEKVKKYHSSGEPLVVSILYAVLKYTLEKDNQIVTALEQELMALEEIPPNERPPNFLEITFHLKREVNQLVPSLLHMKEIAAIITSKRVPLEGFQEKHERLFDILADEASFLHETAENARDSLLSLVELHINTTSFELNKVMRMIAVIACLGIFPAMLGLFGSNLIGNPWDIELWQLFVGLVVAMLGMVWVFHRFGWLKG